MKFRMIKPFVMELIIFIVVIGGVFYGLLAENFIEIKIRAHLLTVTAFLIVIVSLLTLFSRIVNTGIRALIDFVFQHTREDNYVFLEEKPYVASVFTEKVNHERERSYGMYYLVYVRKSEKVYTYFHQFSPPKKWESGLLSRAGYAILSVSMACGLKYRK